MVIKMIYSVKGELIHKEPNLAVIECGGVGYACRTTSGSSDRLKIGEETALKTYLYVREDSVELFGFADNSELNCFKMLISVSGVGPKAALSVLSDMSPQSFALAVASDDAKRLTGVSGIGMKTAQRIILELKDKIDKQKSFTASEWNRSAVAGYSREAGGEALAALMVLGFSAGEATAALNGVPEGAETSERVKRALKKLSGGG
ncbi:MAG: Holliday junction branch migration protein RuvA [Oscillospiraceae bacterium]|jgi:Holliday junction DNA helicase RuvA|nr:Holliday junction branch migration protein RuvA [Oscillospiraceae bacterium]